MIVDLPWWEWPIYPSQPPNHKRGPLPQPGNPNPIYTLPSIQLPTTGLPYDFGFYDSPEIQQAYDSYKTRIAQEKKDWLDKVQKEQEAANKLKEEQEKNKRYEQFLKLKQEFENSDNV